MRHSKNTAIDLEISGDPVSVPFGRLALQGKFKSLPYIQRREMHIVLWDVCHRTAVVLSDFFWAEAGIVD